MIAVPEYVLDACKTLVERGFQVYLVGGAVRDSLLGKNPTDWDLSTDARPEQIENLFAKTRPTGKEFGTVTIVLGENIIEATTMRLDGPYSDSRRPDRISFTSKIKDDLSRRDFTINAIAYDPLQEMLIDPFRGRKDLRRKRLVAVGDPKKRFKEDPLRMLRLLRFQAALGFKIDRQTRLALQSSWIRKVSPERIQNELSGMLLGIKLYPALELFYTSGLMQEILPELAAGAGVSPGKRHPYDLLGHSILSAHFSFPSLHLRWAALLHDIAKTKTSGRAHEKASAQLAGKILRRLRYSNQLISKVETLIANHMYDLNPYSRDKTWRKFVGKNGVETTFDLIKLRQADLAGMNVNPLRILRYGTAMEKRLLEIAHRDNALTRADLRIDGTVLKDALDLSPGPLVGQILNHLLEQVLADPALNQEKDLLKLARDFLESKQ